jgi:hypothetical protein
VAGLSGPLGSRRREALLVTGPVHPTSSRDSSPRGAVTGRSRLGDRIGERLSGWDTAVRWSGRRGTGVAAGRHVGELERARLWNVAPGIRSAPQLGQVAVVRPCGHLRVGADVVGLVHELRSSRSG